MLGRGLWDRPKLDWRSCPVEGRFRHFGNTGGEEGLPVGIADFENYSGPLQLRAFHPLIYGNPVNHLYRKFFPLCEQEVLVQEGKPARVLIIIRRQWHEIQVGFFCPGHGGRTCRCPQ
jgi:hypothetical protein